MPYLHKNEEIMTVDEAIAMLQEISAEGKGDYHLTMNHGNYGFCLKDDVPPLLAQGAHTEIRCGVNAQK